MGLLFFNPIQTSPKLRPPLTLGPGIGNNNALLADLRPPREYLLATSADVRSVGPRTHANADRICALRAGDIRPRGAGSHVESMTTLLTTKIKQLWAIPEPLKKDGPALPCRSQQVTKDLSKSFAKVLIFPVVPLYLKWRVMRCGWRS
jgi:hypothetical protein